GKMSELTKICRMDPHKKWLAYCYALALALWMAVLPLGDKSYPLSSSDPLEQNNKISAVQYFDAVYFSPQAHLSYAGSYKANGGDESFRLVNEGSFHFVFLRHVHATGYTLLKASEINVGFIGLIFPFHYCS